MRVTRLLSTTAAIILIGGGIAAAQGTKTDEAPGRAPAAQKSAPAEKVAPPMAQHPAKAPETTGQGGAQSGAMTPKTEGTERHDRDAKPQAAEKSDKMGTKTGEKTEKSEMKNGKTGEKTERSEMKSGKSGEKIGEKSEKSQIKSGAAAGEKSENKSAAGKSEERSSTTGQGAAGAAKLSTEQRTKITTIIREHKVAPEHLNVSISVGTRIPEHVHLYPLPVEVIAVYPEWRGFDYILVGDEILVIDPGTHEIVAILEA